MFNFARNNVNPMHFSMLVIAAVSIILEYIYIPKQLFGKSRIRVRV